MGMRSIKSTSQHGTKFHLQRANTLPGERVFSLVSKVKVIETSQTVSHVMTTIMPTVEKNRLINVLSHANVKVL